MSYYPTISELLEHQKTSGSDQFLEIRRSFRSIMSHMVWFGISVIIIVLINIFFGNSEFVHSTPILNYISLRGLAIIPIAILLEILRKHQDNLYLFDLHRITQHAGRLSLNYAVPVIRYVDIRGIAVHQDIFGRIFDYGNVELGTAAEEGSEVVLTGVRAPRELARLVDILRSNSVEQGIKEEMQVAQGF